MRLLPVNYKRIHDAIILQCLTESPITRICNRDVDDYRLSRGTLVYTERHHINPKSLGGGDDINNLVVVLPEEHLLLHQLRYKVFGEMCDIRAVHFMTSNFMKHSRGKNKIKRYSWCRQQYSETCSGENHPMFGKTHTEDTKRKLSAFRKGKLYAKDAITDEYIGLVSVDHDNIKTKKWVHVSKGIQSPNKGRCMVADQNTNWSGYSDDDIIRHAIHHYDAVGYWSRNNWFKYCDSLSPPLPKHYQQKCRFGGSGGTGTARFHHKLEQVYGSRITKKRK